MDESRIAQLFSDTKTVFEKSPIREYATAHSISWNYSVTATRLTEGATLIVGFNWGAEEGCKYPPQTTIPQENFRDLYKMKDLGSMGRIYEPLKEWLPAEKIDNSMQANFCFFRSKTEADITSKDLELSTPLFYQLLTLIKPKQILAFSKKLQSHCLDIGLCINVEVASFPSNRRTLHVAKGFLTQPTLDVPIYFLPHPNAKFTSVARRKGWEFCFKARKE